MYQILDGAPVNTANGRIVTPPRGNAIVVPLAKRYAIVVGNRGPIIITACEFDRLIFEGQLRVIAVTSAGTA
jgi:hypothetical protein